MIKLYDNEMDWKIPLFLYLILKCYRIQTIVKSWEIIAEL